MSDLPTTSSSIQQSHVLSITSRRSQQTLREIDLVGHVSHQITGSKLPSNKQVLQVLFYNKRFVYPKPTITKVSAKLAIQSVMIFWEQARIPTRRTDHCIEQLIKLYEEWEFIQKKVPEKRTGKMKEKEIEFVNKLDDLFDISHADALQLITIEEDREFLKMQRKKGRPGYMAGVDTVLSAREQRSKERLEKEEVRKRKYEESTQQSSEFNIII